MLYLKDFDTHASYEASFNDDTDIIIPSVSYCDDANDVHYMRYNFVRFYVGDVQYSDRVSINTSDNTIIVDVEEGKGNKWYAYLLPKYTELNQISGNYDYITKIIVKGNIGSASTALIPSSIVEASFKDSKLTSSANYMFHECSGLTLLDLSNFDTSNVTSMDSMFRGCSGLTSLDLSSFDTSNVTDMGSMFRDCAKLTSLTLNSFDTSNVRDMNYMFSYCRNLKSLNLSNFKTSSVYNMSYMFIFCNSLTSLDLSGFDTSNVSSMGSMFNGCSSLETLDISGWDMSRIYSEAAMFAGCNNLNTIRMKGCSEATINKIKTQLKNDGLSENIVKTE